MKIEKKISPPSPHILVVDDDPMFRAQLAHLGKRLQLPITTCASLRELGPMTDDCRFDLVLMDYFLDGMQEHLKGTAVASVLEGTPVLLMSYSDHCLVADDSWPVNIRKFVNKKVGVNAIMKIALAMAPLLPSPEA